MADIKKLRRQRGHIKATITSTNKVIDRWEEEKNIYLLNITYESMKEAFKSFNNIQEQIEEIDETESDNRAEIIDSYNETRAKVEQLIKENTPTVEEKRNDNREQEEVYTWNKTHSSLPTIELPKFDGNIENWASFYNIFSALIHEEAISDVKKLQYLKLSVTGKAAMAIESLDIKEENYEVAINILRDKYECMRRALRRHWAILRDYPKLIKDSPAAISHLVDVFNQNIRALENLKAPVSSWDIPLNDLILSKLNANIMWQWELTLADDRMPSYTQLLKFLERRANCAESSYNEYGKSAKKSYDHTPRKVNQQPHSHAFLTTQRGDKEYPSSSSHGQKEINNCPTCNEPHRLYTCSNFKNLNVEERRKIIKDSNLCFNCFGKGHASLNCKSTWSCKKCNKRHHTLLHIDNGISDTNKNYDHHINSSSMA